MSFVSLRNHTHYSVSDGLLGVEDLVSFAKDAAMSAIAITDINNVFGIVKFYKACIKARIKPIIGADLVVSADKDGILTLLVKNEEGYRNLCTILSHYHQHKKISLEEIAPYRAGLIAISGFDGLLGKAWELGQSKLMLDRIKQSTEEFYIGISRMGFAGEEDFTRAMIEQHHTEPMVLNNLSLFRTEEDYTTHEIRVCISRGEVLNDSSRESGYTSQQYQKGIDVLKGEFADLPQLLENSVIIAKKCNFKLKIGQPIFPVVPAHLLDHKSSSTYMSELLSSEMSRRGLDSEVYQERARSEEKMINEMGFVDYYLVVREFTNWSRQNGVAVGPGRGSGAGSLVAYLLGITDVDPVKHELLFERFLNPERVSLPDFDIDFCVRGRDRVIEHVKQVYGADAVSQIITFGTFGAKGAVRDVARVLGKPYSLGDRISRLIPNLVPVDVALRDTELVKLAKESDEVEEILSITRRLEGLTRNVGTHAGGVVIADRKLLDYCPFYYDDMGSCVVQFDKDDCESIGLIKFDFLGLKTLTIVQSTLDRIGKSIQDIDIDDAKIYEFFQTAHSLGIFQLESQGIVELLKKLKPSSFEDIVALIALFRPGPLQSGMVDDFIKSKHNKKEINYILPALEKILKPTYGVIVYQEQVMQVARELAGYSLGEADILRRAMGKKQKDVMEQEEEKFCQRAASRGVDSKKAGEIFNLILKFAEYGFNRSHSVAYAMIVCYTAWLKTYHEKDFLLENINMDILDQDRTLELLEEAKRIGLNVAYPSINRSAATFQIDADSIVYGLSTIKGVGVSVAQAIERERKLGGNYKSIEDLVLRVKELNKKSTENLAKSGALAEFGWNVGILIAALDDLLSSKKVDITAQSGLFDMESSEELVFDFAKYQNEYVPTDKVLEYESEVLGIYHSGDPLLPLIAAARGRLADLSSLKNSPVEAQLNLIVFIDDIKKKKTKSGNQFIILTIKDAKSKMEVSIFDRVDRFLESLRGKSLVVLSGKVILDRRTSQNSFAVNEVHTFSSFASSIFESLYVNVSKLGIDESREVMKNLVKSDTGLPLLIETENGKFSSKQKVYVDTSMFFTIGGMADVEIYFV